MSGAGRLPLVSADSDDPQLANVFGRFRDSGHIMRIIERILAPLGRRVDESSPMVDARLPDGSRVNIIIPPVAPKAPSATAVSSVDLLPPDFLRPFAISEATTHWPVSAFHTTR